MKFVIRLTNGAASHARLGFISELHADVGTAAASSVDIETPACWIYTRQGSIPHLTADVMKTYGLTSTFGESGMPLLMPIASTVDFHPALRKFARGVGEFVGLKEHIIYTSVQDPSVNVPIGYNDKGGISVWSRCGRVQLDVEKFVEIQEAFRPHAYQALCDSGNGPKSGKKRTRKALERSLEMLDSCLERHFQSEVLKGTAIFGSIQGGLDLELRKISAVQTALRPVSGFVIEGFYNYGDESEKLDFNNVLDVLTSTLESLPQDKPRVMHGIWRPINVVQAVDLGIDLFDSSYPSILADRGVAFVLPLRRFEADAKCKLTDFPTNESKCELDLADENMSDDFASIMDECTCFTCRKFTRAYVCHLLTTSEMLAEVLLTIHNVHHYLRFFGVIRTAMGTGHFDNFKQYVMAHSSK